MTTLNLIPSNAIICSNGQPKTDSLKVAAAFGKLHKDVLRKIDNLECSAEFASAHFYAHEEFVQAGAVKRKSKVYEMTKDGFMFLVMGFTGKPAAQIKEAFITKFNELANQVAGSVITRQLPGLSHRVKITDLIYELAELRGCSANDVRIHYREVFNNPVWPKGDEFATALGRAKLKTDIQDLRTTQSPSMKQLQDVAAQQGYKVVSASELELMRQLLEENMKKVESMERELVNMARTNTRIMQAGLLA
ncbi:Rha family transcriptional regulator [Enterovibrio sp. ZSDZ42]|uniref:Rha family transcriptional regulator n=1 Tax=Enterovibrio gelatinilyticus TaxID=2899819 RepID=A0ABT5QZ03_9GAMM|nr:Rha family transcriptional regulator [Enterovibrio sp. ZSDZ42]MDD1792537.1 Rha family transcriptional regulator [Enterovibrio sp. ZSDZ42]